jgi:hypothetical protein
LTLTAAARVLEIFDMQPPVRKILAMAKPKFFEERLRMDILLDIHL